MAMMCNYLNDGCSGGKAHYHGFTFEKGHLTTEECAPFLGKHYKDKCGNYKNCPKIAKINKTYWVGGDYNNRISELQIQQDLLFFGPIATSVWVEHKNFRGYKSGVMKQDPIKYSPLVEEDNSVLLVPAEGDVEFVQLNAKQNTQKVNHMVVILGWSTDAATGDKYWIVRNSWGDDWGMNGDFYVRRG